MHSATLSGGRADRSMTPGLRAARLMGWASFGLAAAFLIAPKKVTRTFGLEGKENLIRAFGAQEIMAGMGALSTEAGPAMWGRSAGDVVHIATLATALDTEDSVQHRNVTIGLAALVGFLVVDSLIAARLGSERSRSKGEKGDFGDRSGFPMGVEQSRGASADQTPSDYRATVIDLAEEKEKELA